MARLTSDGRHVWCSTSHCASGRKIVLAKPATSVMAVSARRRLRSNQRVAVAKAGSYSVADIASPIPAQTR